MSLELKIKKDFGGFVLDMELSAADGETLALLGASGCGKSMTLRCIAGVVTPDEGRIVLNGRVLFDSARHINLPPQKRHVGLLFQNYALFPNMTVEQNITAGIREKVSRQEKRVLCRAVMEKFYLTDLASHRPSQLSGGQQQRVALARILISRPEILLLDEPFSALDSFLRWELEQELMRVLGEFPGPAVLVSHDRNEVYRISHRVAVIQDGRVDCCAPKRELFSHPPTYQSALLTGCKNFSRVRPLEDGRVEALDWGAVLTCASPLSPDIRWIGIRPHFVRPADAPGENVIPCRVVQVIDNLTDTIVTCATPGPGGPDSLLHLRFKPPQWEVIRGKEELLLYFDPQAILPLRGQGLGPTLSKRPE